MNADLHTLAQTACLATPEASTDLCRLPWNPHPRFPGVALRHFIPGSATGGALSAHLVRVEAGCCLEEHIHADNLELHQVVQGTGTCALAHRTVRYAPGACGLIPAGVAHSVRADEGQDLYILATFAPALP